MDIRPIRTRADHEAVLKEISKLMTADPELGTPDGDCLNVLVTLVQAFEAKHCPMPAADPIEAIKFRMEQQGLTPRDLEPMIGRLNRVYEVLARRHPLTMAMARRLHAQLGISAESLIGEPDAAVRYADRRLPSRTAKEKAARRRLFDLARTCARQAPDQKKWRTPNSAPVDLPPAVGASVWEEPPATDRVD